MSNLSLLLFVFVSGFVAAAPIKVSNGSTICTTARWDDFLVFFLTNYLTFAATVVRFPGETSFELNGRRGDALLAPYIALMYALRKIQWSLVLERDGLRRACRGEALVQFVRSSDWKPIHGSLVKALVERGHPSSDHPTLTNLFFKSSPTIAKKYCRFHIQQTEQTGPKPVLILNPKKRALIQGLIHLPPGYTILRCQGGPVLRMNKTEGDQYGLYYEHRMMESVLGLCQILFSIVTLYKSQGFQFEHLGYAHFSITVLPFASMCFANLFANCLSMDYPAFHIVGSPELEEAKQRKAICNAVVGQLIPDHASESLLSVIQFSETDTVLHAYVMSQNGASGEDLGEVLSAEDVACPSSLITHLTIPSNTRILEESSTPAPKGKFRQTWRFLLTRDNTGGVLCIPIGVLFFAAPSIVIRLLTKFQSQATILEKLAFLSWIYLQHFALLFLLSVNVVFDVEHSLRAPPKYSIPLRIALGFTLRAAGVAGYICVIIQIRQYGICVQV